MVPVDITLRVERLLADVAHLCVCEFLLRLGFDTRHVFNIGCYDDDKTVLAWILMCSAIRTDLPIMLFYSVSMGGEKGTCIEVGHCKCVEVDL